ncbi:hypothetical protein JIQ42_00861 [Leishmania sp. Namibia]|uniref:hypothetical protein n=1 Tax=Leishmania sp. Namibia TaxID=2802991 RepID=UPI001B609E3D|nr:hypothetical protein JIQ42_00861 [Leishmania sp. Namibia]
MQSYVEVNMQCSNRDEARADRLTYCGATVGRFVPDSSEFSILINADKPTIDGVAEGYLGAEWSFAVSATAINYTSPYIGNTVPGELALKVAKTSARAVHRRGARTTMPMSPAQVPLMPSLSASSTTRTTASTTSGTRIRAPPGTSWHRRRARIGCESRGYDDPYRISGGKRGERFGLHRAAFLELQLLPNTVKWKSLLECVMRRGSPFCATIPDVLTVSPAETSH